MAEVSVIIATYKAEPYIERCARSLFGQTLADMEFIFVDDCSPDRSIQVMQRVLQDYPERREQVKVIRHSRNQGVSRTRQDGVDAATGRYLIHCDPDDWVDPDMYETLYAAALTHGLDFVMFDDYREKNYAKSGLHIMPQIEILRDLTGFSGKMEFAGLCRILVKKEIAKAARLPEGVSNGEDASTVYSMLKHPLKCAHLHRQLYHYEAHPGSLTSQKTRSDMDMDYRNILFQEALKEGSSKDYTECIDASIFSIILIRAFTAGIYSSREFRQRFGRFKHTCRYYRRGSMASKIMVYFSMLGFYRPTFKLYKILKGIR
ncbi:MAG: glycosyltransferase [Bacteroides sp.]|nr:glycosyltransferase [Bacteroides sp.]MCM1378734.1 glycosyltransferase [Bacteroides sp.]MCM1445351.1 glycosyltransferase [Prevotella sp.]